MVAYPTASQFVWADDMPGIGRKWTAECSIANMNSTAAAIQRLLFEELSSLPGSIIMKEVHVCWQATSSGAGNLLQAWLYFTPNLPYRLGDFTTTATFAHFDWKGEAIVKWNIFAPTDYLLYVGALGAAAALDDVWFWMSGEYYAPTTTFGTPTPVSLEGYKWPLTRR